MNSTVIGETTSPNSLQTTATPGMRRLLMLFTLSGVAGLIYEVVWFQLLRLTIGSNSQSLGTLLACFMGGLFVGSLAYARWAPKRWDPLRTYAMMELGIAVTGLAMPWLIAWMRTSYLAHAESSQTAMFLRVVICIVLLAPPTVLMGATLPALARWVKADDRQAGRVGKLYASNIIGAVVGAFGAAFLLLPALEISGTNRVAVGINVFVALVAWGMRGSYVPPPDAPSLPVGEGTRGVSVVYLAYALNGMAALSFEVIWSKLLSMAFAATVYAFAMVLGVFLLGLGLGGATGSALAPRLRDPRRTFASLQFCIAAAVSGTAVLVPWMALQMTSIDKAPEANALIWSLTNLVRTLVVVFPGAYLWGMSFPIALVGAGGRNLGDAAQPVARLYAFNTAGAVAGSLATSFVLIPRFGSATATSRLILLPLAAGIVLLLPRRWPAVISFLVAGLIASVAYFAPCLTDVHEQWRFFVRHSRELSDWVWIISLPLAVSLTIFSATRVRQWWAFVLAVVGVGLATWATVPTQLYMLGRHYAYQRMQTEFAEVRYFAEGVMEPMVVFQAIDGSTQVSINSKICATSQPEDMLTQRMLAHIPVLLSRDPSDSVVVGLGAGVTAGAVAIHERVKHVDVLELEPKVQDGARCFSEFNDEVMDNPKVRVIINDGRHFISTSHKKFGVITSDPVDPWMAGAAALYTVEYFKACRAHLIEGGMFMQWVGMYELDKPGMKSILAAFAEAFPDGGFWITSRDILLVGSTGPIHIDVAALRQRFKNEPRIAKSYRYVGIRSVEDLLACYLCSAKSMKDFLTDAPVNRDRNLYVQFSGGLSYYAWNHPQLRAMLMAQHAWDDNIFRVPPGEKKSFRALLDRKWKAYEQRVARENKLYPHPHASEQAAELRSSSIDHDTAQLATATVLR